MIRPTLFVMAKAPQLGKAKTRLAGDIGKVHALRLYRAMITKVLRQVQDPRWDTILAVTPPDMLGRVPEWRGITQIPQVSGSLSPRLAAVFVNKGPTLAIGTDCPQVTARDIAEGVKALRSHSAVFGPADDGGFWLIGLNGPVHPDVFEDVRWSHDDTLKDMRAKISGTTAQLRTLIDVDNLAALKQVRSAGHFI